VRNKIAVAIIEKPRDMESVFQIQKAVKKKGDFNLIEGEEVITLVTNSEYLASVKDTLKHRVIKINENLVQITLLFDARIETTSGVVSYVYSLLADNGINILEEMSCWTDLMIIIDEKDLPRAMRVLRFG
jgi:aspartokinase